MLNKKKKINIIFTTGFTLIEMLLVIGIIAILAAAIIIAINPGQQFMQARNAARWSHMNAIANAIYNYVIEQGSWPTNCPPSCTSGYYGDCSKTGNTCGTGSQPCCTFGYLTSTDCVILVPNYLPSIPLDPQTKTSYRIRFYNSSQNRMQICPPAEATDSNMPELIQ